MRSERFISAKGFTLIELLIVVAIIAILAAIAVPNFLEAQTRAKVSRCLADMRTIRTGLEAYYVDNNKYPEGDTGITDLQTLGHLTYFRLTTPIAYLTSIPASAFKEKYGTNASAKVASTVKGYLYVRRVDPFNSALETTGYQNDRTAYILQGGPLSAASAVVPHQGEWLLKSVGPDNLDDRDSVANQGFGLGARLYDPTNGTVSRGDIVTFSDKAGTGKL